MYEQQIKEIYERCDSIKATIKKAPDFRAPELSIRNGGLEFRIHFGEFAQVIDLFHKFSVPGIR